MQKPYVAPVDFVEHMKEKAKHWGCFTATIGKDFAVFEFDTDHERDAAHKNLLHYQESYGYASSTGPREQLSIVKGEVE